MVNCYWVEERLSAYIDNELSSQERLAFEAHCDQCDSCRTLTVEYQAIGTLMRQSEARVDTNSLWERLEHRLDDNLVVPITTKSQPKNWVYALLQRIQHPTTATLLINTLRSPLIFKKSSAQLSRNPRPLSLNW